jgi:hypothetical protein
MSSDIIMGVDLSPKKTLSSDWDFITSLLITIKNSGVLQNLKNVLKIMTSSDLLVIA